ncbi:hypothetical protein FA743_00760 [Paracoccus gahaiensis]|uniref:DUF3077 domain-containing protein n=1 Tax=Paracoccus gahaiensis TaxID=1706839 RepID=A0A4U0REL2_9RHOB|nr:hypothetical protein [Paracoccus gahaiensis]TJZ93839.1 hypothetical protein FA743_00760 [Paracoccus gahaiensis]
MADTCHNTPGMSGQSPSLHPGIKARPLNDIHRDAVFLHAFAQGVAELHETLKTDLSPASNSMPAMFETLIDRASRLVNDIEIFDYVEGRK